MSEQDPPRLLHSRSQYGYTSRPGEAMGAEPEAVSADEQREQTKRSGIEQRRRERALWDASRAVIAAELGKLEAVGFGRDIDGSLRAMRRQLAQVDARLGTS